MDGYSFVHLYSLMRGCYLKSTEKNFLDSFRFSCSKDFQLAHRYGWQWLGEFSSKSRIAYSAGLLALDFSVGVGFASRILTDIGQNSAPTMLRSRSIEQHVQKLM
ncbi:MAG: hypothetical protein WC028_09665 [Candidatus Obscuribacterales bacterium]